MGTRKKKDRRNAKRSNGQQLPAPAAEVGKNGSSDIMFEIQCSAGVNALLEPMSAKERVLFLEPVNRLAREFIDDIRAGKALVHTPFHQWSFEHGEHQLVLAASRRPSGIVFIECRTLDETLEELSPENILKSLFELGEESEGLGGKRSLSPEEVWSRRTEQFFSERVIAFAELMIREQGLDEDEILAQGYHLFRSDTERAQTAGAGYLSNDSEGDSVVIPLVWLATRSGLYSEPACRDAIDSDDVDRFREVFCDAARSSKPKLRLQELAAQPGFFLREVS